MLRNKNLSRFLNIDVKTETNALSAKNQNQIDKRYGMHTYAHVPIASLPKMLPTIISHPPTARMNPTDKMMIANPMNVCGRIHTIRIFTNDIKVRLSNKVTPLILIQSLVFAESKLMVKIVLISAHDQFGRSKRERREYSRMSSIRRHHSEFG